MSRPAELLRGPRHRHRRGLGAGSPGGRLRGRRRSGPREQQPGWAPVSVRRHSRPHHGPAGDCDGPALRRADGHRGAAQGAVIVYVGPHRAAVRGTLLVRRASVTRFERSLRPGIGRRGREGRGLPDPRNPTRALRRPRDGMANGRRPRGEISRDRGMACPAQVLSVPQKGLPQRAAHGSGPGVDLPLYYQAFHPKPVASMGSIGDGSMKPLEGKNVLVTGGTGSLGRVLVRRLLAGEMGQPKQVLVFSRDETKQHYMRLQYAHRPVATEEIIYKGAQGRLAFHVGDVREYASVVAAVRRADVVFNAAAMKQVPTCEYFPGEAVETNVLGPANIVRAIRENDTPVETVVGISTDKACKPVNVMGMTKALQERIFLGANLDCPETRFVCVRYVNVTYTGIRPGEKIHEILVSEEECHRTLERDGYFVIEPILQEIRHADVAQPALSEEYSSAKALLPMDRLRKLIDPYLEVGDPEEPT